jgi:hypothetical protein
MRRKVTIYDRVHSIPNNTANDEIWAVLKEVRGGAHYVINARNELGYQVSNQVREPLLDQFAEDLDDV